jgi:hypothetical protein
MNEQDVQRAAFIIPESWLPQERTPAMIVLRLGIFTFLALLCLGLPGYYIFRAISAFGVV